MALKRLTLVLTLYAFWWIGAPDASCLEITSFPLCQPVVKKLSLEKDGCKSCHIVETTICEGYCVTKYPISMDSFWRSGPQSVCLYQEVHYEKFRLSNCLPGVDPEVKYPVAIGCKCGTVPIETTYFAMGENKPDQCRDDLYTQNMID
ncbi:lutropin subunit beta [Nerophis ophidion]|uniref:lutropin subunit beta n=1 Tax=Nerophis ophidion TaxID=159077 RepID=UPI002ADF8FDF|nr:lutropin subunit beta [Nerophis ophidion]